ncbi:uncharacterized protein DSM5745_10430 [Aspergillus mulundensis]|uniref:Box C/D snoRNA protein 1 n=1 Tax=Aspergillus mulundensis TaxID=1810919 RepID=A0A3D8QJ68_9EURO|nr:hypothetical protein DSM5745_10430 [Aspergillus mulundensis]RDW61758.1 hypothetical protein DSM5745_10430 [Aspergillus mulundensis]
MSDEDSLLTNLCAICHIQPPKYRCPRCSTRTCSLPCTRRHKLWSQCSGIRDTAAYLRRTELATESAFDRDFNFITGIERRLERAGRDAENRGVAVDGKTGVKDPGVVGLDDQTEQETGAKRKRGGPAAQNGNGLERGLAKGEAGFLKRAADAGVKVIKAPRGMSRAKANGSRWHPKQKCLHWTIEWVTDNGTKRMNCAETATIGEGYDRAFPLTREERQLRAQELDATKETEAEANKDSDSTQVQLQQQLESTIPAPESETVPQSTTTTTDSSLPPNNHPTGPSPAQDETEPVSQQTPTPPSTQNNPVTSHRNVYFYIHRPRTATKQPVLAALSPSTSLTAALKDRVVLEFPTIYILRSPLSLESSTETEESNAKYILEAEYLRTHPDENATAQTGNVGDEEGSEDTDPPLYGAGAVDIPDVDEGKMLEVLEKDLLSRSAGAL